MLKCDVCKEPIPEHRGAKTTCSNECGFIKTRAWSYYTSKHKKEIMKRALELQKDLDILHYGESKIK